MIPDEWASVQSSNIDQIKYDVSTEELHVKFKRGGYYIYAGVPPEDAEALYHASSPTNYLSSDIIPRYTARRV